MSNRGAFGITCRATHYSSNVQAVRLDVTDTRDIDAAVEAVTKSGRGLYGLVNNAGVGVSGSFTDMKPEEFDLVMAVNVYGPYRVTRAFAPLIISQKGRITTIGSIGGILASRNLGAYGMSKHAMEAFTDSLAAPGGAQSARGRDHRQKAARAAGAAE
jgi:NAD(P)-dependent dehydrogenase (short-subunit alcohol dehydrogenase family)